MQVFTEFIKADLTEDQILPVLRQLLPVLLNILGATEVRVCRKLRTRRLNINIPLDSLTFDESSNNLRFPPMRNSAFHGQRPAPTSC
jgi:hypothetical protein